MSSEKWTEELRNRLEGYRKDIPDGFEEAIIAGVRARRASAWRVAAIPLAAAAAAILGIFLFRPMKEYDTLESKPLLAEAAVEIQPESTQAAAIQPTAVQLAATPRKSPAPEKKPSAAPAEPSQQQRVPEKNEAHDAKDGEASGPKGVEAPAVKEDATPSGWAEIEENERRLLKKRSRTRPSVGLYSAAMRGGNSSSKFPLYYSAAFPDYTSLIAYTNVTSPHENGDYSSHYDIPVKAGISFSFPMTDRLDLETGLNYTFLQTHSSMSVHQNTRSFDFRYHYVGIPAGIHFHLLKGDRISLYASASGEIDWCIDNSEYAEKHPVQFSLSGGAGVQYDLSRLFALYIETAAGYYFDDGSPLNTIYKSSVLVPEVKAGLRFSIGR